MPKNAGVVALALVLGLAGPARAIDMVDYILPGNACSQRSLANDFGNQRKFTIPMGMAGSLGRFVIMKGTDATGFEEWYVDRDWFYIRADTTWAWENPANPGEWCDTQCGNGNGNPANCRKRWAGQWGDWAYTLYFDPANHALPARWVKRDLALPAWGSQTLFQAYMGSEGWRSSSCAYCGTNFDTNGAWRTTVATRHQSWHYWNDVVELHITGGPGAGEHYFFARGKGWVGFNGAYAGPNQVADGRSPQFCSGYSEGSICAAVGGGGTSGSLTGGRVLDHGGNPTGAPAGTHRDDTAVQPGQTRQSEAYWGLRGIDGAYARGESCNAGHVHIAGWHGGDLGEYRVNFPSAARTYELNVIGIPDDPAPVVVDVYVDGTRAGSVTWNDGNPRCNEGSGGGSQRIRLQGYQGEHAVAFVFANDYNGCGSQHADSCDRNFWFDQFSLAEIGGGTGLDAAVASAQSSVPSSMAPGERRQVRVRMVNTGGTTWRASQAFRLGAAAGNGVTWSNFACGGYQNSMADARVFLCGDVAPGGSHDFTFDVTVPAGASGSVKLAVRMVQDGVAWFGQTGTWTIAVGSGGGGGQYPSCPCGLASSNYCDIGPRTSGCPMTFSGGYCDPNGDGNYADADWVRGWNEYRAGCGS